MSLTDISTNITASQDVEDGKQVLHIFHHTIASCKMVLRGVVQTKSADGKLVYGGPTAGKTIHFVEGKYYTDNADEIEELKDEIRNKHPFLYIKKGEETILKEDMDPIAALKKNIRAEIMAEMAAKTDKNNDMGNSVQGPLKVQNSNDVASAAGSSDSGTSAGKVSISPSRK